MATNDGTFAPAFEDDVHTVGQVQLDDGPGMYGRLEGDPATFVPDAHVHAAFREIAPGVRLVDWEPDAATVRGGHRGVS